MLESFYLRYKNKIIGAFEKREEETIYLPDKEVADTIPSGFGYPLGLFPLDTNKKGMVPITDFTPGEAEIKLWLSDRVFPPNREGAYKLLQAMGLNSYDIWKIAKITNAISFNDHYWMSANRNDKYENIHPRFEGDNISQTPINGTFDYKDQIEDFYPENEPFY